MGVFTSGFRVACDGRVPLGYTEERGSTVITDKRCGVDVGWGSKTATQAMKQARKAGWKCKGQKWFCPDCLKRMERAKVSK